MTSVLICDERRSARDGLTRVMTAVPSVDGGIDCVASGDELLSRYGRQPADVVLIGTQRALTSGIEATRRLLAIHPSAVVIVFVVVMIGLVTVIDFGFARVIKYVFG